MLRPLIVVAGGAACTVIFGFLGAYLADITGAIAGMIVGIVGLFALLARDIGR